jgi:hypothetical protein
VVLSCQLGRELLGHLGKFRVVAIIESGLSADQHVAEIGAKVGL